MIVISTDTVVVCTGTKRDCQCQIVVTVTKSFYACSWHNERKLEYKREENAKLLDSKRALLCNSLSKNKHYTSVLLFQLTKTVEKVS